VVNEAESFLAQFLAARMGLAFASGTPMMSALASFYGFWTKAIETAIEAALLSGGPPPTGGCVLDKEATEIERLHTSQAYRNRLEAATPLVGSYRGKPYQTARYTLWNASVDDPSQLDSAYFIPELFAHLCVFSCLRKRTVELAQILRGRAASWAKDRDFPDEEVFTAIPICVGLAMSMTPAEEAALQHLRSPSVGVAVTLTERLHAGELHISPPVRGWTQWKRGEATLVDVARSWLPEWMRRPLTLSRA